MLSLAVMQGFFDAQKKNVKKNKKKCKKVLHSQILVIHLYNNKGKQLLTTKN